MPSWSATTNTWAVECGRDFALAAPLVVSAPDAASRLGARATGLDPWHKVTLPASDGVGCLEIRAVPAVHGPAEGDRDADGNVNCEVTGFVVSGENTPTVYLSGDNASMAVVRDVALRIGPIDIAVLFVGAARVPSNERGRPLTLTSACAAAAAELLGAPTVVPARYDGWAHFTEGINQMVRIFDDVGLSSALQVPPLGEWVVLWHRPVPG
jgi:L-ascorbate metabolism protein UlaG (beta-lactamase superfamily)